MSDTLGELERELAALRLPDPSTVDNTDENVIHVDFVSKRRI